MSDYPITSLPAAVAELGALPMPAGSVRLTAEREAEIRERAPKRTAEFTKWLDAYSPMPGGEVADRAETVLEEDVPALLDELAAVRAELDAYEVMNPQQCQAGKHADWLVDSEHTHACPWCEIGRLKAELTQERQNYAAYRLGAEAAKQILTNRVNAVLDLCDREERNAMRWENPIPVPEWVAPVQRAALGDGKRTEATS